MTRLNHRGWVVRESIMSADGCYCVDFFEDAAGAHGFEHFRSDPEDEGRWTALGGVTEGRFGSALNAVTAACTSISWLLDEPSASAAIAKLADAEAGALVTETLGYDGGRQVTVYVPPDPAEAVVFAADGAWHIARMSEVLEFTNTSSTMIVGVHGLPDDEGRLHEYVPEFDAGRFAAHEVFFVDDVVRWIDSRFGVALPPERTAVWGASLGGEFALATGLRHPDVYGVVFSASPGAGFRPPKPLPTPLPRVYLVAGTQEQFFLDNATRWADALRDGNADVVMMQREGAHGGAFWGEEFPLMVAWAFGD